MTKRWFGIILAMGLAIPAQAQIIPPTPSMEAGPEPMPFEPPPGPPGPPQIFGGPGDGSPGPSALGLPSNTPNAFQEEEPIESDPNRVYVSVEWLVWWLKKDPRPLVTSAGNPSIVNFGQIGQDETQIVVGSQDDDIGSVSGGRATLGLAPAWFLPVEFSGFFLRERKLLSLVSDSTGLPVLARPIFSTFLNGETVFQSSFPGVAIGSVFINTTQDFWSGEVNVFAFPFVRDISTNGLLFDITVGGRYLVLNEDLSIHNTVESTNAGATINFGGLPFPPGFQTVAADFFEARNTFRGGQLGARTSFPFGWVNIELKSNLAFGVTHQVLGVGGYSLLFAPPPQPFLPHAQPVGLLQGGVQALPSNSGLDTSDKFSVVSDLTVAVEYPFLDSFRLSLGYNLMYWSNVIRPGHQLTRIIDTRQAPTDENFDPTILPEGPPFPFRQSGFWAQGINVGLAFTY